MTKHEFKERANEAFGKLLRNYRRRTGSSLRNIAETLGATEFDLRRSERYPAEIPAFKLYRIIKFYGPEALFEAEIIFQEIDELGRNLRTRGQSSFMESEPRSESLPDFQRGQTIPMAECVNGTRDA